MSPLHGIGRRYAALKELPASAGFITIMKSRQDLVLVLPSFFIRLVINRRLRFVGRFFLDPTGLSIPRSDPAGSYKRSTKDWASGVLPLSLLGALLLYSVTAAAGQFNSVWFSASQRANQGSKECGRAGIAPRGLLKRRHQMCLCLHCAR